MEATVMVVERVGKYMSPPDYRSAIQFFKYRQGSTGNCQHRCSFGERVMPDSVQTRHEMFTGRRPRAFQLLLCWHGHSRTGASMEARSNWEGPRMKHG